MALTAASMTRRQFHYESNVVARIKSDPSCRLRAAAQKWRLFCDPMGWDCVTLLPKEIQHLGDVVRLTLGSRTWNSPSSRRMTQR